LAGAFDKAASLQENLSAWRIDQPRPQILIAEPVTAPTPDYPPMLLDKGRRYIKIIKAMDPDLRVVERKDYYYYCVEGEGKRCGCPSGHYSLSPLISGHGFL
jgi:hypothetical protein